MSTRRIDARRAWFELVLLLAASLAAAQASFLAGAAIALLAPLVFRLPWWVPWMAGMALLPPVVALAAVGRPEAADRTATLLLVYIAISVFVLALGERRRLRQ